MRTRARPLTLVAVALASMFALAGESSASAFLSVTKRDISGKTGRPERSVEVRADGAVLLRDGTGEILASGSLSAADLAAFRRVLSDDHLLDHPLVCGAPLGADLPERELALEFSGGTSTLRIRPECSLPPDIARLEQLLEEVEGKYLPAE